MTEDAYRQLTEGTRVTVGGQPGKIHTDMGGHPWAKIDGGPHLWPDAEDVEPVNAGVV